MTPRKFLGYRLLTTAVPALLWIWLALAAGASAAATIVTPLFLGAIGWVGPAFVVHRRATSRLDRIDYEIPELVDLLVTAVEGGLGFSASLQIAIRNFEGPLGEELRLALQEQSMGLTMSEALSNFLTRSDTPAVHSFVQAVVQGETLGVSIGKILRDLAGEMRRRRRQAAEERAHKAGTKILFPLVLFIFPALFIVILFPVMIEIVNGLGAG
jgi:tight adherence protein C